MDANDPTAASRKKDHIDLAFQSQVANLELDSRFFYEPMLSGHPGDIKPFEFLGKTLQAPIWVSSMTGGTEKARQINQNLARAAAEFGMGMGLGSCRSLLEGDAYLEDFNVRSTIGRDLPLFANLGIAQIEILLRDKATEKAMAVLDKLSADGLFIHVNPLQEWLQPEGDQIEKPPIETIGEFLALHPGTAVVVKEVGQGMGRDSLAALLQLPLAGIEFAAHGGTNFSKLELLRNGAESQAHFHEIARIGHSAADMVGLTNALLESLPEGSVHCKQFIVSGGVRNFLDGYYLTKKLNARAVYGQASTLLKYAANSYEDLRRFIELELKGFAMAQAFLRIRH